MNAEDPITLPPFPLAGGETTDSEGRFVFFTSSGLELIVIVQAAAGSGAAYDFGYTALSVP